MRKLDYLLHTSPGNYSRYMDRYCQRLTFQIHQETYSKNSMPLLEKQRFRSELDIYLRSIHRNTFLGPVVLQLDFFPKRKNPPSIHKLAKNYIDLLYSKDANNCRLPLKDDQQISMLIVNYHVQRENKAPSITLTMAPMRDFILDLKLYQHIRNGNSFSEDDGDYFYDENDIFDNLEPYDENEMESAWDSLEDFRELANIVGEQSKHSENIRVRRVQSVTMKGYDINPHHLALFFDELYQTNTMVDRIFTDYRKWVISPPLGQLRSLGLPYKEGDSEQFKKAIEEIVEKYKRRYSILTPFLLNVKLTILYVPAESHEKDLDNIARQVIPIITDILKPPTELYFDIDSLPKGYPKHSIIQYQIVKLPRSNNDPLNGILRLVLGEYEPFNSLWEQMDRVIDRWASKAL